MFDKVVFAGGGQRCWWQAGFWDRVSSGIELHPRVIAGVSSGAMIACLLYASDSKRALGWYERELKSVRSNFNWLNLLRRDRRLMPNTAIQRKALRALLGGDNFRQLMWRAPEIRVQYARLPEGANPSRAVLGAIVAGRAGRPALAADGGRRAGLVIDVKRVQDCRSERELVDLLAAANSAPPFTAAESLDGVPCLDAGLFGEVPLAAVADVPGQTLVLTTRRDPALAPVFARDGCVHVQPSEKIPVGRWDYTSVARYRKAYELGQRDGEAFLKTFALGQYVDSGLSAVSAARPPAAGAANAASPGEPAGEGQASEEAEAAEASGGAEAGEAAEATEATATTEASEHAGDSKPMDAGAKAAEKRQAGAPAAAAGADGAATAAGGSRGAGDAGKGQAAEIFVAGKQIPAPAGRRGGGGDGSGPVSLQAARGRTDAADAADEGDLFPPMHATDDVDRDQDGVLDVSAKLAAYREPTDAGTAEDLRASQPAESEGQLRSGRSLRASNT